MKQQVDLLIANDEKLQLFFYFGYIGNQFQLIMYHYKPIAVRVFYLAFVFYWNCLFVTEVIDLANRF